MKRSNMTTRPTMIVVSINPFQEVRGGSLNHRVKRQFLLSLISLLLVSVMLGGACRKQPAAVEIKGPILAMTTATGYDDRGRPQNPSFAFAPTEPQLVVIVQIGKLDAGAQATASSASFISFETVAAAATEPVLNIAWYRLSDKGEQKLFEHQIPVRAYDHAYSIGKSKGKLRAGGYKVKASLAGETQEIELKVKEAKSETSSGALPQARVIKAAVVEGEGNAGEGDPPADGGSGTIPQQSRAGSGDQNTGTTNAAPASGRCDAGVDIERLYEFRAKTVPATWLQWCPDSTPFSPVNIQAGIGESSPSNIGTLMPADTGMTVYRMRIASATHRVDPCLLPNGSDLPKTKVVFTGESTDQVKFANSHSVTLGPDEDEPEISVNSSPAKGTKVKPGDVIKIDATARERPTGGTWQTGVQLFQLTGPEGLIKEVEDSSRLPKPCESKSWSKVLAARYTVPPNPPPVIKLCAIAEDYAGNESAKCAEFPTGDVWKGTMRSEVQASFPVGPGYSCSSVFDTTLELVVNATGEISGHYRTVYASSTCHRITPHFSFVTGRLKGRAYNDRLEFYFFEMGTMVPAGSVNWGFGVVRGETPYIVPITAPGIAEGQSTARYAPHPGGQYATTDMIRLRCETCAP